MKKILAIILALLLGFTVLSACGGGLEDPPPLPPPRVRGETPASPIFDPPSEPPADTSGPEGFYTIVSLGDDGDDLLELYVGLGMDLNDFFIELRRDGVARMGIFPEDESDIDVGTFTINGSNITFYFDDGEIDGTIEDNRISFGIDGLGMVFEKNDSFSGSISGGSSDASDSVIPGNGGTIRVDNPPTEFTFIPGQTGLWEFRTSNEEGDPYLELYGGDYGGMIDEDDDSGGGYNALIQRVLREGEEFRIVARNWGSSDTDSFTLTVQQITPIPIPGHGASVQVDGQTYFTFVPDTSGMWEFITSDNGNNDPKLHIYDIDGFELYDDDDSADGINALINARLESGTTYYIRATFFGFDLSGSYLLTVTLK